MSVERAPAVHPSSDRVCVTGALGFVGSHLCRALIEGGREVVCVDSLVGSYAHGAGPATAAELAASGRAEVVRADLATAPLEPLLEGVSAVVHLAGLPGVRARHSPADLRTHNVRTATRLVSALGPGRRLVLASSSSVYGEAARGPTPEDCEPAPLNAYAGSKLEAERECLALARRGADVVVARLFTVFGPSQRPDMAFARWIDAIAGDRPVPWCARRGARRELTYVGDAARGLVAALERGRTGEVYNLAGGGSVAVRAALAEIEELLGRRARLSHRRGGVEEAVVTAACGDKAREELGYLPTVGLREGLEAQVEAAAPAGRSAAAA